MTSEVKEKRITQRWDDREYRQRIRDDTLLACTVNVKASDKRRQSPHLSIFIFSFFIPFILLSLPSFFSSLSLLFPHSLIFSPFSTFSLSFPISILPSFFPSFSLSYPIPFCLPSFLPSLLTSYFLIKISPPCCPVPNLSNNQNKKTQKITVWKVFNNKENNFGWNYRTHHAVVGFNWRERKLVHFN